MNLLGRNPACPKRHVVIMLLVNHAHTPLANARGIHPPPRHPPHDPQLPLPAILLAHPRTLRLIALPLLLLLLRIRIHEPAIHHLRRVMMRPHALLPPMARVPVQVPRRTHPAARVQRAVHAVPVPVQARPPAAPLAEHLQAHEVLAQDHGDEDAVLLRDELLRLAALGAHEQRVVAVFAAAHVASRGEGVELLLLEWRLLDFHPADAGTRGRAAGVLELDVGDLRVAAFEGGHEGDGVFERGEDGLAGDFDDDDGVFEGEAVEDVFEEEGAGGVDLVAADGAAGHQGAVGVVEMAHEVADEVPQVGFLGANGRETAVERHGGVSDRLLELVFQARCELVDHLNG